MRRSLVLVLAMIAGIAILKSAPARTAETAPAKTAAAKERQGLKAPGLLLSDADKAWWQDAKFGMFIHWGLYAIPAQGEWYMHAAEGARGEVCEAGRRVRARRITTPSCG